MRSRKIYQMQDIEHGFMDLGFKNREPSLKRAVFKRYNLKELTGQRRWGDPSGRHKGITWIGGLLAEGSSFLAKKVGSGIRQTEQSALNLTKASPLRRACISLILSSVARVRRKRVFWDREAREALWEKSYEESNWRTSSRLHSGGFDGRKFRRPREEAWKEQTYTWQL